MNILGAIWPVYVIVRAILIFLDAAFVFIIIFAGFELLRMRPRFVFDPRHPVKHHGAHGHKHAAAPVGSAWKAIREKMKAGTPEAIRISIIEADGLVDNVLKKHGYGGDTFADRLAKLHPQQFESLGQVWDAHRLRNDIVHTPGFEVSLSHAEKALDHYEQFLKELGALDNADITVAHGGKQPHSAMVEFPHGAPPPEG